MSDTQGKYSQAGASNDLQIFVGATEFIDTSGFATTASSAAGYLSKNIPAADASTFFANITAMLKRTGIYAIPLWSGFTGTLGTGTANAGASSDAFGTAASVPGPTTVTNTRGPLGTYPGAPPYPAANLDTLTGGVNGPPIKGFEILSVDVIYEVDTVAASAATIGLTDTTFSNNAAPTVVSRIALGSNGLPVAINTAGQQHVQNVAVATPTFPTSSDTETICNVNLTAGAGGTIKFFGVVLHINFNLN